MRGSRSAAVVFALALGCANGDIYSGFRPDVGARPLDAATADAPGLDARTGTDAPTDARALDARGTDVGAASDVGRSDAGRTDAGHDGGGGGGGLDPRLDTPPAENPPCDTPGGFCTAPDGPGVCRFFSSTEGRCESCTDCGNLGAACTDGSGCDILFACFEGRCTNICPLGTFYCGPVEDCLDVGHPTHGVCRP